MSHFCEALVNDTDFDAANDRPCDEPATVKHGSCWFCDYHFDLFFAEDDTL